MAFRNDPSSVSFGRLLRDTATTVQQQQQEIESLKRNQLSSTEKVQASQLAAERKSERTRALQMIASNDSTVDDYSTLDQALLTTAQREQIRHNLNALQSSGVSPVPAFDRDALQRIQNFRDKVRAEGMGGFIQTATPTFSADPLTPFDRWVATHARPETQKINQQLQLEEMQRAVQQQRIQQVQQKPRSGGIDFSNPNY